MEDKQLDFNQPLLSVRRFSSTAVTSNADEKKKTDKPIPKLPPLPFYKSELKSGPIQNPGTVPFVWEKTPGKPKDERKSHAQFSEQPPIAPRLPPGRVSNIKKDSTDKGSRHMISTQHQTVGVLLSSSNDVSELDKTNTTKETISTRGKEDESSSGSEDDDDEAYMDALDTLSRSDSFSMACSVSCVSGSDGLDLKPSGTFWTDPQTRDFMMGRFLPAAKAMASETPQYASKKQLVAREQLRHVNKVANGDRRRPPNQYQPNNLPPYAQELRSVESDDESDICEGSDIMSAKVCGLFPRFCVRSSLCLLNPVPGMKPHSHFHASSVRRVHANSASATSCSETKTEHVEDDVRVQTPVCHQQTAHCYTSDIELKYRPNQIGEKSGYKKLDQPSMSGHQQANGLSAHHNRFSQSKLPEEKGFLGVPEKAINSRQSGSDVDKSNRINFKELLASDKAEWEVGSGIPVAEKTLYIDFVHAEKSPSSNSSSSDIKSSTYYKGNDVESPEKSSVVDAALSLDSSLQDIKCMSVATERTATRPKRLECVDSCSLSRSGRPTCEKQMDMKDVSRRDGDLVHDSLAFVYSKVADEESFNSESHWSGKSCYKEKCHNTDNDFITSTVSKISDDKVLKSQQPFGVDNLAKLSGHVEENPITSTHSKLNEHNLTDFVTLKTVKLGNEESSDLHIKSCTTKVAKSGPIDLESQQFLKLGTAVSSHENILQMTVALPSPKSPSDSWLKRALPVVSSRNSRSSLAARIGISSPMMSPLDPKWEMIVKTSNLQQDCVRFSEEHLSPIPEA